MSITHVRTAGIRELLAKNLRSFLEQAELSGNALSKKSNVSQRHVNGVTRADVGCGIDSVAAMADALKVPAWQLLVPGIGKAFDYTRHLEAIVSAFVSGSDAERTALYHAAKGKKSAVTGS